MVETEERTLLLRQLIKSVGKVDVKLDGQGTEIHEIKEHLVELNGSVERACTDIARMDRGVDNVSSRVADNRERISLVEQTASRAGSDATEAGTRSWQNYAKIGAIVAQVASLVLLVGILAKLTGAW